MAETMAADDLWITESFRQSVRATLDETIQKSVGNTTTIGLEWENHIFQKAKSQEEYLCYVAKLILNIREMSNVS